jgi:PucR-like helix-turn-helix protein/diguanylate cyclase with GGDEF domain
VNSLERVPRRSIEAIRVELEVRLRNWLPDIEKAVLARIHSVLGTFELDPVYAVGLRSAVAGALDYCLAGIAEGVGSRMPIPPEVTRQARRAARDGVGVDTVLRGCAAGNKSFEEFITMEAAGIPLANLYQILNEQGPHFDRLMKAVSAEYKDEFERSRQSPAGLRADRIQHLLKSGCMASPIDLAYDFEAWHVGIILVGPGADRVLHVLAESLGYQCLAVLREQEVTWGWLGSDGHLVFRQLEVALTEKVPARLSMATGEPRRGLDGWRLTHHEAQVALRVMLHRSNRLTRCRDVILTSAIIQDQSLVASLIETFLAPLDGRGETSTVLRRTLRAYFDADQNVASAAAALGVARQTVDRRLRNIERRLGQALHRCGPQLNVALCVEECVNRLSGAPQ